MTANDVVPSIPRQFLLKNHGVHFEGKKTPLPSNAKDFNSWVISVSWNERKYRFIFTSPLNNSAAMTTDDVTKWKHFSRYWPFMRGIPRWIPHKKVQWRGAFMFSLIYAWINGWTNTGEAGDLRCHHAHYDVILMIYGHMSYGNI